jgi:hypothetical protein
MTTSPVTGVLPALLLLPVALPVALLGGQAQGGLDLDDQPPLVVTPEQRSAVDRGLTWLAERQNIDGSWSGKIGYKLNNGYDYTGEGPHVGVTSLACMAFLAGGHLPGRGEYGDIVERGLDFVIGCCRDDGYITYGGSRMYSHAFSTLFLAEIYGMTHREDVRVRLQNAVDFIVRCQNEEGGWRYEPFAPESDMSIVVCQVIALRAARNIGIRVPRSTVDNAAQYVVDSAITVDDVSPRYGMRTYRSEVGAFRYQKNGGSRSSFALASAGVTALHGLGIYSDEAIEEGLQYLQRNLDPFNDEFGLRGQGHYFFWYGHYYAVQAMYTAGNRYWEPYFENVREELIAMQEDDGAFPNRVGPGENFGTAMAVLILEIPYRFLPIFQR